MNQFNQMGLQSMGQRSTPPLPMGATGNQVSTESILVILYCTNSFRLRKKKASCTNKKQRNLHFYPCIVSIDGNGGPQDGAAQCKPASESVFVSGAISRSWTRSWTSSAWDCPTWHTDKHGTGMRHKQTISN